MKIDQIFTNEDFANRILRFATVRKVKKIGDFAVGDGALLAVAQARWPEAKMYGLDLDPCVFPRVTDIVTACATYCGDFLNGASSKILQIWGDDFDLVLLNPPFSVRQRPLEEVVLGSLQVRLSPAAAFLVKATRFVRKGGQIIAIIPHGVWHSERDKDAVAYLEAEHSTKVIDDDVRNAFKEADVRCMVIKITVGNKGGAIPRGESVINSGILQSFEYRVVRGSVNHVSSKGIKQCRGSIRVIHTTNLAQYDIRGSHATLCRLPSSARLSTDYAVMLPRVGRPSKEKIVVVDGYARRIAPTQCVLAVECSSLANALRLHRLLRDQWKELESIYGGTGAQYTTVARLEHLLVQLLRA